MKRVNLKTMSVEELVALFIEIARAEDEALLMDDRSGYNKLFEHLNAVKAELKQRPGDQRRALLPLFEHANAQVRLMAAKATLALDPEGARRPLQRLSDAAEGFQTLDAGMCLNNLDRGIFKPT